ncbi:MAG: putative selenate reductase subunit YgfK [Bacteroidales bacterium]|nr:putative selenate reductase subunit YgfK [Bacteroidales bacterium]
MTDRFSILPPDELLTILLRQYDKGRRMPGIVEELFFNPIQNRNLRSRRFGQLLETPVGAAAGPHTQLAQNIVAAWLTGARFIELKTVQTLDELEVSKPCIDMQDEGYNCEWSQELKIEQSFDQYLNAWIIIHILRHKFKWGQAGAEPGVIFNMSVGYDLQGILKENVQWFFSKMADASEELQRKTDRIKSIYPAVEKLKISPCISNNVTLSTMHGCPADEIESIGAYLLEDKKLHTTIKLNPTLLGKDRLHEILGKSGFETKVPDLAFEHDLKYGDAVKIIRNLQKKAAENKLHFGLKLTNTLESLNHKEVFGPGEEMMYMSGKALHPISVNLAARLQNDFNGQLDISFSGGADAFNVAELINCGLGPVTVCTDLLKPGGYGRLQQYLEKLSETQHPDPKQALDNLNAYATKVEDAPDYKKTGLKDPDIKTGRKLGFFDCIHPPCVDTCPTSQAIPDYLYHTSQGKFEKAAEIIVQTNPFPHTTGMVCDHLCQTKCTRINYDSPLLIREIKRFIAENYIPEPIPEERTTKQKQGSVSVIGAGPSGLSCAYFLAKAGFKVDVFETKNKAGGMVSGAIPSFRLTDEAVEVDIHSIEQLGVKIHYGQEVDKSFFKKLKVQSDFIFIGTGAKKSIRPNLPGMDAKGVLDPLDFLFDVKQKINSGTGKNVVIIGGGNTAMDAARTAYRLVGEKGKVTIVYRRTIKQMPADLGEIKAVLEEGVSIAELAAPVKLVTKSGRVSALVCIRMKLEGKDSSGRARPVEVPGSEFEIPTDTLIPAIGQEIDIDFADSDELLTVKNSYETRLPRVFIGGDALRGASTAINAIGDGRKAAQQIIDEAGIDFHTAEKPPRVPQNFRSLMVKKARREKAQTVRETPLEDRKNFRLVSAALSEEEAVREASRCLLCDEVCSVCVSVCPNLAFHSYEIEPVAFRLQKIVSGKTGAEILEGERLEVVQKFQILHIADWCNRCGNCDTFCPTAGAPYLEKPHLYLNRKMFGEEKDGCFLETGNGSPVLLFYENDEKSRLSLHGENVVFENSKIKLELDISSFRIKNVEVKEKSKFEVDLKSVAGMFLVMQGALDFLGTGVTTRKPK